MTTYKAGEIHGPGYVQVNHPWSSAPWRSPGLDHETIILVRLLLKLCRGTKSAESSVREASRRMS